MIELIALSVKKKDLKYHHVQVRVRESTSMVNCSIDKEWPIGRNHPFPQLIIEVFEVSDGVTADGEPVDVASSKIGALQW